MTPNRKLVVVAITSFLGGIVSAGLAGYVGFNQYLKDQFVSSFYVNAVHAQFEVRALSNLRSGNTAKVVSDLDTLLNSHTMQLAEYETIVAPARRETYVYRTLGEVREYREAYPAHFDYPPQQEMFQKALDLGRRPEG